MRKAQRNLLSPEALAAAIERRECDGEVCILYRGLPALSFSTTDPVGRDYVIATLLRNGLSGKTVAALCGVSPAHVTGVRKRVEAGGTQALAARGKRGAPPKITARKLDRLRRLYDAGEPLTRIADALEVDEKTVRNTLHRLGLPTSAREGRQTVLAGVGGAASPTTESDPVERNATNVIIEDDAMAKGVDEAVDACPADSARNEAGDEELKPGEELPPGPSEHPTRYAGTLLLAAAMEKLGVPNALRDANAVRPVKAVYKAEQMVAALACAWMTGHGSLESMHERDARGLGVVLGLERSPSVRTAHRAIAQMVARFDPIALGTGLMDGLRRAGRDTPMLFGIDGHHKAYAGTAPIDKGWNSKRRMATPGLADVMVHDAEGKTWMSLEVAAGDALSQHVVTAARRLRHVLGEQRIVLGFDRGGFCFETLCTLQREGFGYVAWVPANAKMPDLASVAPAEDGVGEVTWEHDSLDHSARLLVERDGDALLPAVTNLPAEIRACDAMQMLRQVRGAEENAIKAARASVHIDRLVDRGVASERTDDRLVANPAHQQLRDAQRDVKRRIETLENEHPRPGRSARALRQEAFVADLEKAVIEAHLRETPAKVPRNRLEPEARRAWLKTQNRALLQPLKLAADNARRWLLATLGIALAPTDHDYDATAMPRTLMALLRTPGTVRFARHEVVVTLDLPLPPTAHARLEQALHALDDALLVFPDARHSRPRPRAVRFRLAPRPTRAALPHRVVRGDAAEPGL